MPFDKSSTSTRRNVSVDIALDDGQMVRCWDALLVHPTPNKVLVRLSDGTAHWFRGRVRCTWKFGERFTEFDLFCLDAFAQLGPMTAAVEALASDIARRTYGRN